MARIVVNIKKNLNDYSYGYSTIGNDNVIWSDSNILNINASGEFYILVKNKRTLAIERKKKIYILCLNDEAICNINAYPFVNVSSCKINTYPAIKVSSDNTVCKVNVYPIKSITVCNINNYIIKVN